MLVFKMVVGKKMKQQSQIHKRSKQACNIYFTFSMLNEAILISSLKKLKKYFASYCVKQFFIIKAFLHVFLFETLPLPLLTVRHIFEISGRSTHETLLMDFALRYVRFYPGVNTRAELVTLAPGLRPERRFAPLAQG